MQTNRQKTTKSQVSPNTFLIGLATILVILVLNFGLTAYSAFVLGKLWSWFFVPEGFEVLSFSIRVGIMLLVNVLVGALFMAVRNAIAAELNPFTVIYKKALFYTLVWVTGFIWQFLL